MGERDFARLRARATPDKRGQGGGVMRIAKRPMPHQPSFVQQSSHRVNHADFKRLGRLKRWQDAGKAGGQQRFAGTRRTHHQQVVTTCGGDFERPFGRFLPLDIAKVEMRGRVFLKPRDRRGQDLGPLEMIDQRQQRRRGQEFDLAGPGRLAAAGCRTDQAARLTARSERGRQSPGYRLDRRVKRDLAEAEVALHLISRQHTHRGQEPGCNRQIEMGALLHDVGRGEIDRDPLRRQGEAKRIQGAAHPLPAFRHRLVRQADEYEGGQAIGDLDLNLNGQDLNPLKRDCMNAGGHHASSCKNVSPDCLFLILASIAKFEPLLRSRIDWEKRPRAPILDG